MEFFPEQSGGEMWWNNGVKNFSGKMGGQLADNIGWIS